MILQSAVQRGPISDRNRPRSSKDTRKWCRGVAGRNHQAEWQYWFGGDGFMGKRQWERMVCAVCHRRLKIREGVSDQRLKR